MANNISAQRKRLENLSSVDEACCQDTWNLVNKVRQQLLLDTMKCSPNGFKTKYSSLQGHDLSNILIKVFTWIKWRTHLRNNKIEFKIQISNWTLKNPKARDQVKHSQQRKIINWLQVPTVRDRRKYSLQKTQVEKSKVFKIIIIACSYYISCFSICNLHKPTWDIAWTTLSSQYYRESSFG